MPEHFGIVARAVDGGRVPMDVQPVEMPYEGRPTDTLTATERMHDLGVAVIVVLGGDGTSRLVASRSGDLPLVAVSTGTNNAFPSWIDGTVAGIAAGLIATGRAPLEVCAPRSKRLVVEIEGDGERRHDSALVDLAISRERFVAARALWDPSSLAELFLARAEPGVIGLSAIGAHLQPIGRDQPDGLWLRLGDGGRTVAAPIVPGIVRDVGVREWQSLRPGQPVELTPGVGVVALDGEREHELGPNARVRVELRLDGPRVVEIRRTIDFAARAGRFAPTNQPQE
jgi:predicted polyphosphate/ATP-dependent NAD kinase